jgi:magnesium transporter
VLAARRPCRYHAQHAEAPAMLLNCVAYQNGRKLAEIPVTDISEYVKRPDCFVWVALFEPSKEELDQMAQ